MRYIVVTGGVISGIGKGITSSSIGALFQAGGYTVTMIKIDPYLNVDASTMGPYQHGECFVLHDGGECDLDLGNYERFLNITLDAENNITTGSVYASVIEKERRGDYLGSTVQVVPHVTDEIIDRIRRISAKPINGKIPDICIIELGGTIGDIEGLPFIEALQQMSGPFDVSFSEEQMFEDTPTEPQDSFCFVHVAMTINQGGELKTKPIQHSISALRSRGVDPNILVIRCPTMLSEEIKTKLQKLCRIPATNIVSNPDVDSVYHVTGNFNLQHVTQRIARYLKLSLTMMIDDPHQNMVKYHARKTAKELPQYRLAIVGKYLDCADTYLSLSHAIQHAAFALNIDVECCWIDSEHLSELSTEGFLNYDGCIIPGGFGSRGIPGKLHVSRLCYEHNIPLLGICLGMQVMVVDAVNRYLEVSDKDLVKPRALVAASAEWGQPGDLMVVDMLPDRDGNMGGTLRKGDYATRIVDDSVKILYPDEVIVERHRHRYEVTRTAMEHADGLVIAGIGAEDNELVEIVSAPDRLFYVGCQYHPEYISRLTEPHPLFLGLLRAMSEQGLP